MGLLTILKKQKEKEKEMRLLMLGLDNAGKTTIVKKFNGEDVDTIAPTLGFNIKTLECVRARTQATDGAACRSAPHELRPHPRPGTAASSSTFGMWVARRPSARTGATTLRRRTGSSGWWIPPIARGCTTARQSSSCCWGRRCEAPARLCAPIAKCACCWRMREWLTARRADLRPTG